MINFPGYVKAAGLGAPIAGNYFTVEVGTAATVSPMPTSAVNTATLLLPNTSPTGNASKTTSRSLIGTPNPTASAKSGALTNGVNAFAAGAVAMVFGAMLA